MLILCKGSVLRSARRVESISPDSISRLSMIKSCAKRVDKIIIAIIYFMYGRIGGS